MIVGVVAGALVIPFILSQLNGAFGFEGGPKGIADAPLAAPQATLKLWDGVNHVLKTAPADRAANIAAYSNPDLPLAPDVVEDVAAFIQARTPH